MRTVKLSERERWYILAAFTQPLKGPQGPRGADLAELKKSLRVFDKLELEAVMDKPRPDNGDSKEYKVEDADFTYLDRVFRDANCWTREPSIARDLGKLDKEFTEAVKTE